MTQPPQRMVIPILAGLGNSLMAMPMVRQVKRAFPNCRITILARSDAMGEPFRRMPEVEETLITSDKRFRALIRSIRWTRPRKPDVYLIPFPSNRWHYSLLALTSGAKRRILHSYPVGYFRALGFTCQRMPAEKGIHDVVQNLRLLKMLGIEPDESEVPVFPVSDADRAGAAPMLEAAGVPKDAAYIAVHAGSGSYTVIARAKRWPPRSYAELAAGMRERIGKPILLLEGPDETGVASNIVTELEKLAPRDTMRGLHVLKLSGPLGYAAAVLERAAFYVGSDSGLAHLASAVGKRAVTIFAPADPDRVCPVASRDLVVQTPNSCSPCFTYPFKTPYTSSSCREPFCIGAVTVDRVLAAATRASQT
jgi:ADP-heptose:LPS heptosyltransferase